MSIDPRTPVDDLRRIEHELRQVRAELRRLAAPSGSQAFRTVELLQEARTYVDVSGSGSQVGPGFTNYADPPSVSFTVSRDVSVLITASMPYEASIPAAVIGQVDGRFEVVGLGGTNGIDVIDRWRSGEFLEVRRSATGFGVVDVPAGTWTVEATTAALTLGGGAGTDYVTGFAIALSVSVLGES